MTTLMVDTFGFSVAVPFPHHFSKRRGWKRGGEIDNDWKSIDKRTLGCTDLIGSAEVSVRFLESNYIGYSQMNIQVSALSKVFCDNNFLRSTNLNQDFINIASMIQETFILPEFNIFTAHLYRLDLAAVFLVKNQLSPYLQAISQLHHPDRDRNNYCNSQKDDDNGTEFFSDDQKITSKFYDVYLRTKDPRARGPLKFEMSIINTANIRNYILTPNQLVGDLTEDRIKEILNNELAIIGANRPQKHLTCLTDALIAEHHKKKYDVIKFKGIYQYICVNWKKTTRQLAEDLGVTQEIIRDRKNEIIKMGGPFLDFSNKRRDLPGLVVQ